MSNKWVVYCAGNSEYMLSPSRQPIHMFRSFQRHFGNTVDYVYLTDQNEPRLDEVSLHCGANNIELVLGDFARHYDTYTDIKYIELGWPPRWPSAMYWSYEAPLHFHGIYERGIKCDGDILCVRPFDLDHPELESDCPIISTRSPDWYSPADRFFPNAGVQIINMDVYVAQRVNEKFRVVSTDSHTFNSDQPALDYFVRTGLLQVIFISANYNYTLYDIPEVQRLQLEDVADVNIVHFVGSKPHNLHPSMVGSIKEHFANIYLELEQ